MYFYFIFFCFRYIIQRVKLAIKLGCNHVNQNNFLMSAALNIEDINLMSICTLIVITMNI